VTGRPLRCGCSDAAHCIHLHWRGKDQAYLVEYLPGKWRGPCPKDGRPAGLHVQVGDNGAVIWNTPLCAHGREAAYPMLKARVPCAPDPGYRHNPELDALKEAVTALAVNKTLTPAALRLAILEAAGTGTDEALDVLGITDKSNRRRAIKDTRRALARLPGKMVKTDHNRTSAGQGAQQPGRADIRRTDRPAETRLPAVMVKTDPPRLSELTTDAGQKDDQKPALTSTFPDLTDRANVVSGPAGWIRNTSTALDLDLALKALKTDFNPETVSTWTPAEEGPCTRCGARTCRYGDRGSPLCANCQIPAEVRRPA
jgi:hypothetical protein